MDANTAVAVGGALALVDQYLRGEPGAREALSGIAQRLIQNPHGLTGRQMVEYHWERVAETYADSFPLVIISAVLDARRLQGFPIHSSDTRLAAFAKASENRPEEAWEAVSKALVADREAGEWNLWFALRGWYAGKIPKDILLEWAESNQPEGPRIVAALAPVGGKLGPLLRELVIRYHDDEHVLGAIVATHYSGVFHGSTAHWLEGKAAEAGAWAEDKNPVVREWARQLAQGYRESAAEHRVAEEEEDLFF